MRHLMASACFALLVGCATPYQKNGLGGGYVDEKIDEHSFHLSYYGNSFISSEEVFARWQRRATELCGGEPKETKLSQETKAVDTVAPSAAYVSVRHNLKKVDGVVTCR